MDFMFDGETLSSKGYMVYYDNIEDEELPTSSMTYKTIRAAMSDISHMVAHEYEDNYSRVFAIMKSPCENNEDMVLTEEDISNMTRWLVRKQYKEFRYVDENGEPNSIWYKVQNKVDKIVYAGDVIGLKITVNSNAPYAFETHSYEFDSVDNGDGTTTYTIEKGGEQVEFSNEFPYFQSDEEGYCYFDMTLTLSNVSTEFPDLQITTYPFNLTSVQNVSEGETITIHGGDILQIESDDPEHVMAKDFNYSFPRFVNEYNNKHTEMTIGNCDAHIVLTYNQIRKVGL